MNFKFLFLITVVAGIAGCQSAIRQYDGVLGYKVISRTKAMVNIVYNDEDRRNWSNVISRAHSACAYELSTNRDMVTISEIDKVVKSQDVDFSFPIPVGTTNTGDVKPSGSGTSFVQSSTTMAQAVRKNLKIKSLTAECRVKS